MNNRDLPPWLPDYEAHLKATGMRQRHLSRTLRVAKDLYAGLGWHPPFFPYHFMQGVHVDLMTTNLEGYKAQFKFIYNVDNDPSRGGRFRTPFYHLVKYQHICRERVSNPPLELNEPALPTVEVEVSQLADEAEEMEVVETALPPPVVQIAPPPPPPLPPPLSPASLPPPPPVFVAPPPPPVFFAPDITLVAPSAPEVDVHIPLQRPSSPSLLQAASRLPRLAGTPAPGVAESHTQIGPSVSVPSASSSLDMSGVAAGTTATFNFDAMDIRAAKAAQRERERAELMLLIYPLPSPIQQRCRSLLWHVPQIRQALKDACVWGTISPKVKSTLIKFFKTTEVGRNYLLGCGLSSSSFAVDHIVGIDDGGSNAIYNMCLMEPNVNSHHQQLLTSEKKLRLGPVAVSIAVGFRKFHAKMAIDISGFEKEELQWAEKAGTIVNMKSNNWKS
jgi:hypothetical protein